MKKTTLRGLILSAVLLIALSSVSGQGFFIHNHTLQFSSSHTKVLPNGYEVQLFQTFNPQVCVYQQTLSTEGEEQDWTNECNALLGGTWLSDDLRLDLHAQDSTALFVVKRTVEGDTLWWSELSTPPSWTYQGLNAKQNAAGEIFLSGRLKQFDQPLGVRYFGIKFATDGTILWSFDYPVNSITAGSIKTVDKPDGGCVYWLSYLSPLADSLQKRASDGTLLWSHPLPTGLQDIRTDDEHHFITVSEVYDGNNIIQTILRRYDENGNLEWSVPMNAVLPADNLDASMIAIGANQDILVLGQEFSDINSVPYKPFAALFDINGNFKWKSTLSSGWQQTFYSATPTPNGSFIIVGSLDDLGLQFDIPYVMKLDSNGVIFPGTLTGKVGLDANSNCHVEPFETPLYNWLIQATGDESFFATTDATGQYSTSLPGGNYEVSVVPPSYLWASCPATASISIPDSGSTVIDQDFAISAIVDCPSMSVSVSTWLLRRCHSNTYTVSYCNDGTAAADSAYVQITLDPALDFDGASIPYTQSGDVVTFQLGTVASLYCGSFNFNATPNCDETEIGQTICVSATIYPDTFCNPPAGWSGATLVGSAACEGDSVRFVLKNAGNGPSTPGLNFVVVDDHVIMMQSPLPSILPATTYETTMPSNGDAWRFLAQQEPNHPNSESISVGVEGCNGPIQPGSMLEFPNTDGRPATARDCEEIVGSWDPNDKSAAPRGVGDEHYITPGTPLTYHIRFQNTGTDTAFSVVVRDTLSALLNPATLRLGASSHPYSFEMLGNGIAIFTFDNIALPDSNVNKDGSQGFVEFSIAQKADIPLGTVIQNRAGIYFDLNPVVLTNTVWHTVDEDFLSIASGTKTPAPAEEGLNIYPNPSRGTVWIACSDKDVVKGDWLRVYNTFGKLVAEHPAVGAREEIKLNLPAGVYFVEWTGAGKVKGRGRMVRQ